jgi:hypothetical protein
MGSVAAPGHDDPMLAFFVWTLVGLAIWHFCVLVPDRFAGGIVGALLASIAGAYLTGLLLPQPGVPATNPPGTTEALWPIPGALAALSVSYWYGARSERG